MKKFQLVMCCLYCVVLLLCSSIDCTYAESSVVNDSYTEYVAIFGNSRELADLTEMFGVVSDYETYNPRFVFTTEEYSIRVPEVLTDGSKLFANVELTVNRPSGIVRPYEFSLENSRYHTPLEHYDVPVYYFLASISFDSQFEDRAGNWGITNDNRTMNRLEYHTGIFDTYELNSDGTVDVYFLVSVITFDGERHQDDVMFVVTCPIHELK